MTPIFYDEAAMLLDISVDTLRQAVSRKVLTKLPRQGQRQRLIKEQVMLFVNPKKRLSLAALTPAQRQKWQELALAAVYAADMSPVQVTITPEGISVLKDEVATEVKDDVIRGLIDSLSGMLSRPKISALA